GIDAHAGRGAPKRRSFGQTFDGVFARGIDRSIRRADLAQDGSRPIQYPILSPRIAPAEANAISTQMFSACVFPAYNAAATSSVAQGPRTLMLSRAMAKVSPQ